ncbi:VOC family protein [Compostimonas suwonensis]|uniref:Catechol 2,3-dioxygenase n=1 Tax=Compostimonas suwonensis TaxID=1048394 RepID=A0A2M9C4T2_9MICO|nr:VOC family protein [Compostimonas suwonensis]PJJ65477.1 catechol 2,3-dioxygenase [Compostimonas suwonensis]
MNDNRQARDDVLAAGTSMGAVTLAVADLDRMIAFYTLGVGLTVLAQSGGSAVLGRGTTASLVLEHTPALRHASPGQAGLFHTAILFAEQSELAASVYSVATKHPTLFTGSSDHIVSKAFYFDDPEGNGVELYWDRPRDTWQWNGGQIQMGTLYLDPNQFLQQNLTDAGSAGPGDGEAGVGHVHLKVGDVATARDFYVGTVGFEETIALGGQALFVSAGGYHHHVGMNTWQSQGAGPRTPALGLGQVSVELPTADDLGALEQRLASRGVQTRNDGAVLLFDDPWANLIRVTAAA